jgi:hypothetical protein
MTCHRDRLPKEIPETNLHKKKTDSSPRPKAARFFNPINAVKALPQKVTGFIFRSVNSFPK